MMNCQSETAVDARLSRERKLDLLETVRRLKASLGDGLNEAEFNRFLQARNLPLEEGFGFLCFCDGCVTLSVPAQDENSWHPQAGWVGRSKEKTAEEFAEKHGLVLSEPPDVPATCYTRGAPEAHHHLRFSNRQETVVIAHPNYLKVRLFAGRNHVAVPWSPGILRELSALYQDA